MTSYATAPCFRAAVWADESGVGHVLVSGDVDLNSEARLQQAMNHAVSTTRGDIVLDLGGVTFAGVACVNAVIATDQRLRQAGRRLMVRRAPRQLRRVLAIFRATELLAAEG